MPRGYPPWFGQSVFNKHGPTQGVNVGPYSVVPVNVLDVVDIALKGEIFGGDLSFSYPAADALCQLSIICDGISGPFVTLVDFISYQGTAGYPHTGVLTCIYAVPPLYRFSIGHGITFETDFRVRIRVNGANSATNIICALQYSQVQ